MILLDFSPVTISNSFANLGDGVRPDKEEFRTMIFNTLARVNTKNKDEYGELVICMDSKPYWRRDIFPHYKRNRKPLQDIHWDVIDEVKQVLHERLPFKIIEIPRVEADDIIGVLVHRLAPKSNEKFLIISPDGDFKQLQCYPNVSQINIHAGQLVKEHHPKRFLREQIIRGQKKDAIPNIKSDPDTLVNPDKRQKPIRQVDVEEWVTMDPSFYCSDEMMKRYRLNEKLIDLSKVPEDIEKEILYAYALAPKRPRKSLRSYFIENRLAELADRSSEFK